VFKEQHAVDVGCGTGSSAYTELLLLLEEMLRKS
jgi:precorrin-6B methylase 2